MTNEEAIKNIVAYVYFNIEDIPEEVRKAFDIAITALKEKQNRIQGECENCDFRKFSETFIDGVVDVMNKNGITSVEQLSELLKGDKE